MNKKKIFITGSAGLIGSHLYQSFKNEFDVFGIDIVPGRTVDFILDLEKREDLYSKLQEIRPDIVIHSGAIKGLQACEDNKIKSWNINVNSTLVIVEFAQKYGTKVVYISSDVVFDGIDGQYIETDHPHPINIYGKTKYASEMLIETLENYAICRTALVVGDITSEGALNLNKEIASGLPLNNQSFLPYYILEKLNRNEKIKLPDNVISNPTHVKLLSFSINKIINENKRGIFHCVGSEAISRYEFGKHIAAFFKKDGSLLTANRDEILSFRPKNLSMNYDKTYQTLGLNASDWNVDSLLKIINVG